MKEKVLQLVKFVVTAIIGGFLIIAAGAVVMMCVTAVSTRLGWEPNPDPEKTEALYKAAGKELPAPTPTLPLNDLADMPVWPEEVRGSVEDTEDELGNYVSPEEQATIADKWDVGQPDDDWVYTYVAPTAPAPSTPQREEVADSDGYWNAGFAAFDEIRSTLPNFADARALPDVPTINGRLVYGP